MKTAEEILESTINVNFIKDGMVDRLDAVKAMEAYHAQFLPKSREELIEMIKKAFNTWEHKTGISTELGSKESLSSTIADAIINHIPIKVEEVELSTPVLPSESELIDIIERGLLVRNKSGYQQAYQIAQAILKFNPSPNRKRRYNRP